MQITKFRYLLISMVLACYFWNFTPIVSIINRDLIWGMSMLWTGMAFILRPKQQKISLLYKSKYTKFAYIILLGVFISMINAWLFWEQNLSTTIVTQRFIYVIITLPALLYLQPTFEDVKKTLKYISILTLGAWIISILSPSLIQSISIESIERRSESTSEDIGYNVSGIQFVILYFYILVQDYIKDFSYKKFMYAMFWAIFLLLYQNRSLLIGVIIILIYSILKLKSKYKPLIILGISILFITILTYSSNIISSLIEETNNQLNDQDYNRWKALRYFFNDYSPNTWCYIFGNGLPAGGKSDFGNLLWENMKNGIYGSDLGLIGMWVDYGILPIICIYLVIYRILKYKYYPLYLKFLCTHILLVPTIFHFWENPNLYLFIILFYLYSYYTEKKTYESKLPITSCCNNNSLQK